MTKQKPLLTGKQIYLRSLMRDGIKEKRQLLIEAKKVGIEKYYVNRAIREYIKKASTRKQRVERRFETGKSVYEPCHLLQDEKISFIKRIYTMLYKTYEQSSNEFLK